MIGFAIGTGDAILAWIGLALGLVIAVVVLALLHQVARPALEIRRYADHILQAGLGIARNLDGAEELADTHKLATALPRLAAGYLHKVRGGRS